MPNLRTSPLSARPSNKTHRPRRADRTAHRPRLADRAEPLTMTSSERTASTHAHPIPSGLPTTLVTTASPAQDEPAWVAAARGAASPESPPQQLQHPQRQAGPPPDIC